MTKALDGIKILDLTRLLPGSVCSMLLGDLGADVIKVEDPRAGDYARHMHPQIDGMGVFFRSSNRNKRSIVIDLKQTEGQSLFYQLAQSADVILEGFRPSVTERLNIDYATVKQHNPSIIYCSLSGWGQTGPYRDMSGHDLNYVSLNGILGSTRTPHPLGAQIADVGGAYVGVMGILASLFKRERTGEGDYVDVALHESGMPFAMAQFVEAMITGITGGNGLLTGGMAFYEVYYSSDEQALAFGAIEPKFWANFCNAVQKPEWIPRHANIREQASLKADMSALFKSKTASEWDVLLSQADCCFTIITPTDQLIHDPQVKARQMAGVDEQGIPWMRSPIRLISDDSIKFGNAPQQGEHTQQILSEMGMASDEIDKLLATGIVRQYDKFS
ncbi:MAG: CaiB/BaiF CoA-transferase family protein [Chloroflexota bacterium]